MTSHASRRREVVPAPKGPTGDGKQLDLFADESDDADKPTTPDAIVKLLARSGLGPRPPPKPPQPPPAGQLVPAFMTRT